MSWLCEAEDHVGSRSGVAYLDRFTRRQTFMRADGKQRIHERSLERICRACIRKEVGNIPVRPELEGQSAWV